MCRQRQGLERREREREKKQRSKKERFFFKASRKRKRRKTKGTKSKIKWGALLLGLLWNCKEYVLCFFDTVLPLIYQFALSFSTCGRRMFPISYFWFLPSKRSHPIYLYIAFNHTKITALVARVALVVDMDALRVR